MWAEAVDPPKEDEKCYRVRKCCQRRRVRGMKWGPEGNPSQCGAEEQMSEEAVKVTPGFRGGIIAYV